MNTAGLSLSQSPPLSVPAPYMVTAPLFAAAAGGLLVLHPELLQDRWLPGTLALTHLVTLGFLAMIMVGAFQQLLPVLAGVPVPRPRLVGGVVYLCLAFGVIALGTGFLTGTRIPLFAAMGLLALGALVFVGVAGWCLSGARSAHATLRAMAAAVVALLITALLGAHLVSGHAGLAPLARHLTDLHAQWGLLGWIALLVMGVAYQVVPMFQVTPDYPRLLMRGLAPAIFLALVAWSAAALRWPQGAAAIEALLALGLAGFAGATLLIQQRRRRRLPDVTLDFWRLAMLALLLAAAVWLGAMVLGRPQPTVLLAVLFLAGFAMSVVNGMLYKIIPFLVWLHLNNRIFAQPSLRGRVPHMKQVIPERRMRGHFLLHLAGLLFLVAAAATGDPVAARGAGVLVVLAASLQAFNLWAALALYRRLCAPMSTAAKGEENAF